MSSSDQCAPILVCFAVPVEARPFQRWAHAHRGLAVTLTGMGHRNAERSVRAALAQTRPRLVISSGFAGGLDPELKVGTVAYEADEDGPLTPKLRAAGLAAVRFHCAASVASSAAAKQRLWRETGAQAVEMESGVIRAVCSEPGVAMATVRVILDHAQEDLPLDFNRLLTPNCELDYQRLVWTLLKSPGKIPELLRFQKRIRTASEKLAAMLSRVLGQ